MRSISLSSRRRMSTILVVVFLWLIVDGGLGRGIAFGKKIPPSGKTTVRDIVASWKKREKSIKNIKARILVNTFKKTGNVLSEGDPSSGPQKPAEYSQKKVLVLDFANDRYRVEVEGGIYSPQRSRVRQFSALNVFSNGEARDYSDYPDSSQPHSGAVERMTGDEFLHLHFNSPSASALNWYVMPFGRSRDGTDLLSPQHLRIIEKEHMRSRAFLKCAIASEGHIWLQANAPYLIVRSKSRHSEGSIEYEPNKNYGPVPKKWTYTLYSGGGRLRTVTTCELTELVINTPMKASLFRLEFPEKTVVEHLDPGNNRTSFATKGGELVSKLEFERRNTPVWMRGGMWLLVANLLAVIVLFVVVFRKRLQRV